jgi:uncharacterized protein YjbI with pentapeptide repeats
MANEEQLVILKEGAMTWNNWRVKNPNVPLDLSKAELNRTYLCGAHLMHANFSEARLSGVNLSRSQLKGASFFSANLDVADLSNADLGQANLKHAQLAGADLSKAELRGTNLTGAYLSGCNFSGTVVDDTIFASVNLSEAIGLQNVHHRGPSHISVNTFILSKGKIPEAFLRGCGVSDWEIEVAKLYNPDLSNEEINNIQYKIYDFRATQALQISPLFISYSRDDGLFIDKVEKYLNKKRIRFWRDIHDMKAGRIEPQIDRAIRQNPTILLVLSENSLSSDWVEHEVRTARQLEKDMARDVLCPVALDDSWKSSRWPKRIMEQIMEYNVLDFSAWEDDVKFEGMFRKLIDGLKLFYKG